MMVSCKGTKDGIIPKKMLVDIMEGYQSSIPRGIQWLSNTTDASMVNEDEYDIKKGRIPEMDHSLECSKGPGQGEISGAKLCISMSNLSESCGGQKSENDFQYPRSKQNENSS
jgi:hypothetical protein